MKANYKYLKVILTSEIKKLALYIAFFLGRLSLFDRFKT